mmetsp:Transcript_1150/g.3145  ORF Transcript_1150/g.3145 Transcript_1150/m.3145 type:complete len:271 (-) Transcript_1150:8-820(-)
MMDRHVSSPIESASLSGPSTALVPSRMPRSMSSGEPTPSIMQKKASLIMGMSTRYMMKPGRSCDTHTVLPSRWQSPMVRWKVESDVCMPLASSTSGTDTTGCMKCMPMTRCGFDVTAASRVIEIELVFDDRMLPTGVTWSSFRKMAFLISSSSGAASMTKSAARNGSSDTAVSMRASVDAASSGEILPLFTCFSRLRFMTPIPRSIISNLRSERITRRPRAARTCAMPVPIWPAPITPTTSNKIVEFMDRCSVLKISGTVAVSRAVLPQP